MNKRDVDGRWEVGGGRWEVGGGRWEVGGGRWEVGGGKRQIYFKNEQPQSNKASFDKG